MTRKAKPADAGRSNVRPRTGGTLKLRDTNSTQAELWALTRQSQLVTQLLMSQDANTAFGELLSGAIEIVRADRGTFQLWDAEAKQFQLAAQRGFGTEALQRMRAEAMNDGSPHLRAVSTYGRIVVEDTGPGSGHEDLCDGEPWPCYRAVQSTPLVRRSHSVLGVLSTYHGKPHRPSEPELRCLDLYTRQAADFIGHLQQRESASDASRRKDEFLALLAHELRSPLAPISAGLELLRTTVNDPVIVHEVHQIIQRQLDQLTALINDVFDISCITRGVFSMKSRRIDIKSVVENAAEQVAPAVKAAGHTFSIDLPHEPLYFDGDPRRVVQVLSNLLDNAIKHTPRGGTIRLAARRDGNVLVVSVEDNGVGIAAAKIDALFAKADRDGAPAQGSGIGLMLVRSLVELHGGTVNAYSAGEGKGATFTIRLPAAVENQQAETGSYSKQGGARIRSASDRAARPESSPPIAPS